MVRGLTPRLVKYIAATHVPLSNWNLCNRHGSPTGFNTPTPRTPTLVHVRPRSVLLYIQNPLITSSRDTAITTSLFIPKNSVSLIYLVPYSISTNDQLAPLS